MATYPTIGITRQTDNNLNIQVVPPTSITGWSLAFLISYRLGGSGILIATGASGFTNGQSGIIYTNPVGGQFSVFLPASFNSGLTSDVYWGQAMRTDSGSATMLSEISVNLLP